MTERRRFTTAGDAVLPRWGRCSAATTRATTTGTASATCCRGSRAGTAGSDTRLFVDVIRHMATTGIAWADRPASAGKPNRLRPRYRRRGERGVWERIAAAFWKLLVNTIRDAREIGFGAKGESPSPG